MSTMLASYFINKLANPSYFILLDGAMGTFLRTGISVEAAHEAYIEAGADLIRTSTFDIGPDSPCLSENAATAVNIAEKYNSYDTNRTVFVGGSIGPTTISPETQSERKMLFTLFRDKAASLADCGVDLLIAETFFDYTVSDIALDGITTALSSHADIPLIMFFYPGNNALSEENSVIDSMIKLAVSAKVSAIGYNCFSENPTRTIQKVNHLKQLSGLPVFLCPSAGIPDFTGHYPISAKEFASFFSVIKSSASISGFGGCCGTTPEYIKAIKNIA